MFKTTVNLKFREDPKEKKSQILFQNLSWNENYIKKKIILFQILHLYINKGNKKNKIRKFSLSLFKKKLFQHSVFFPLPFLKLKWRLKKLFSNWAILLKVIGMLGHFHFFSFLLEDLSSLLDNDLNNNTNWSHTHVPMRH